MRTETGHAHVEDLYESWFLDYASYVILDRAVPHIKDGLKPVQRRILYALWELDDGRLNKAANVIGHTMRYHPHGDMAIEDALVKIAQKELLIDMQGNWGNTFTGDRAAAPRYIEARLSVLGKEILFNESLTEWQASYDGRNREPTHLPVKFPLLLALGVEGIAVGLQTKILPHNFAELCDVAILHLQGKPFTLLPDFPSGGLADFSAYQEGRRGGRIRVRAKIKIVDVRTLQISDLPFGTTTVSLIESILTAHEKGKIKIKRVEDNTGYEVDIRVHLPTGVSAEQTMEALYAFTDCEVSISVNCCVIQDEKPAFLGTRDLLTFAVDQTRDLLKRELELNRENLLHKIHKATLEQIFIEQKIYRKLEGATSWEEALPILQKAFKPHLKEIVTTVTDDDLEALLEIRFKRLTKFDSEQANKVLEKLQKELKETEGHLKQLTAYTVNWYKSLKQRFGKTSKRRTEIAVFGEVSAREVVLANQKLYVNRQEGFLGTGLKKDEFLTDCSDLDEVLAVRRNGQAMLVKVSDKAFVGEDLLFVNILPPGSGTSVLHIAYREQEDGPVLAKAVRLSGWSRDKSYELAKGIQSVLFVQIWPEGTDAYVEVKLVQEKQPLLYNMGKLTAETRNSRGRVLTLRRVESVARAQTPKLTLKLTYDGKTHRLGESVGGKAIGTFAADARLLAVTQEGHLRVFTAAFAQKLPGALHSCLLLPQEAVLSVISRRRQEDVLLVRRLKTEEWGDGSEFQLSELRDHTLVGLSFADDPLLRLTFKAEQGPPEIMSLSDWVSCKAPHASPTKIARPGLASVLLLT
ncbi:MAG TPA: DNA gyrase/topoisomerase IV subunit A [Oligoflexus sp.]|uniref:DNA gyrase/topoisomerase IV subunit A n=1 Tax=Oligoflexus sp. TaxID=1971216 RepID=UPI002D381BD7|nr:DNA gyrase/topoisomerase IV subunit A [Oligoflexus sp.]HYX35228.1 DNA gyrase/topoisomerase IV subunit A [Oligoflexus sp.]